MKAMTTPRRWSFGLRTLFVLVALVSVPLGWLGREWQLVRERKVVADWIEQRNRAARFTEFNGVEYYGPWPSGVIRRFLGDRLAAWVYVEGPVTEVEWLRVTRAFPEAKQFLHVPEPAPGRPTR